ncbi:hypothetical protein MMC28_010772 [Mycoblastus sanguinarius]|nr:hypothetical protein [Mycoblastus sanguinarius]
MSLLVTAIFFSLLPILTSSDFPPQHIFTNPSNPSLAYKIPTIHGSAVQARRILNLSSIATLSTVFPSNSISNNHTALWGSPHGLSGAPIGLMDYYASCTPRPFDPTILAIGIATTFRNAGKGSNVTLSLRWHPPPSAPPSDDIYAYSPANMPRFSLLGDIEPFLASEIDKYNVKECFLARHPDAEAWLPGNEIHESSWVRLVVREIYWIGGFGDRAYIGWIPGDIWRGVTDREVERARLKGEDGYEEYMARNVVIAEEL